MSNIPFIILVGKSGSGKSSIAAALASNYGFKEIKTYTTRPPRFEGEDTHTFVDKDFYYKSIESGSVCASTVFDNNIYFTTLEQLNTYDIAIWDVDGVKDFQNRGFSDRDYVVIYIDCPLKTRLKNMIRRGDSVKDALRRIKNDSIAFKDVHTMGIDLLVRNNGKKTLDDIADRIHEDLSWCEYLNGLRGELFYER